MKRLVLVASCLMAVAAYAPTAFAESKTLTVGVKRSMTATLIAPDGPGPYPGVLILHTSAGLERADLDYAKRLSDQGYVCLVPAFMEAYGITNKTYQQTFTSDADDVYGDLVAAIDTLRASDKVSGGKVAAIGFSNGGYFAMWLAATGKVDAGVGYYGTYSGAGTDKELKRFQAVFTAASAPVLILHGTVDRTVPVAAAQRLAYIAKTAGAPYQIELYESINHRFERDIHTDGVKFAADDAWQRTLTFLGRNVSRP